MHSDITFIASDLLAAEKVQNILRESLSLASAEF